MANPEDNTEVASLNNDIWTCLHYKTDRKGRTNWLKIGRAWAKPDSDNITLKLYALPVPNIDGEVILNLVFDETNKQKP